MVLSVIIIYRLADMYRYCRGISCRHLEHTKHTEDNKNVVRDFDAETEIVESF
jgi:hypothetical protein